MGGKIAHAAYVDLGFKRFGFIHFDLAETWLINKTSDYHFEVPDHIFAPTAGVDFVYTAIHEIGHLFGFDHAPRNTNSVMGKDLPKPVFGEYSLSDYDVKQIQTSYGMNLSKHFPILIVR